MKSATQSKPRNCLDGGIKCPSIKSVEALRFKKTSDEETRTFSQRIEPVKFYKYLKVDGDCQ